MKVFNNKLKSYFLILFFSILTTANATNLSETNIIDLNLSNYIPVITGKISNKDINLLFDSGATTTLILNEALLESISDVKKTGNIRKSIDSRGEISVVSESIIPKIIISSSASHNVLVYPYRPWGLKLKNKKKQGHIANDFHESKDGILGIHFFSGKKIIIDYSNKKLIVFTENELPEPYNTRKWFKTDFRMGNEGLIITGSLNNNKNVSFLLDTGATASILHSDIMDNKTKQYKAHVRFSDFPIDKHLFQTAAFQEPKVDGILGYNFFNETLVFIDLPNQKLYLAYPDVTINN